MVAQQQRDQAVQRFVVLDGLRGAAAFAVVTVHARSPTLRALLSHAPLAVDFFFVLSGFVIAHSYGERFRNGLGAFDFMRARWVRFWPMLLAAFVMVIGHALLAAVRGHFEVPLGNYLASVAFGLAFLPVPPSLSADPRIAFPLVGPAYTMFLELSINLVFALIAVRLTRSLLAAVVVAFGALLLWTVAEFGTLVLGWPWHGFIGSLPRVGFSFFAGVLVYDLWRRWRPPAIPAWASFAVLVAVFLTPPNGAWFELVSVFLVFPALVMFSAGARATGLFEWACLRAGMYSYAFYILHQPVIRYVESALPQFGVTPEAFDIWLVLLVVAISIVLAVFLTHFYERPFRRILGRALGVRAPTGKTA